MKLKIKVKYLNQPYKLAISSKGDWIDLSSTSVIFGKKGDIKYIPLGIAMKLPSGCEVIIAPRSSTPKHFGFIVPNSFGVIDNSYCGNEDEVKCPALFFRDETIKVGDRICQLRIQLSQKASMLDKLRWLFSSGVRIVEVDDLKSESRGGFGTTGKN